MAVIFTDEALRELQELTIESIGIIKKETGYVGATNRCLVIGAGGMGQETIVRLKENLTRRIGIIEPSHVQFRVFDTATNERAPRVDATNGILTQEEFPLIHNSGITRILCASPDLYPQSFKEVLPNNRFRPSLSGVGSNQNRLAGGLTVLEPTCYSTIYDSISTAISNLGNFVNSTLDCHIICGIGGGCGSGMIPHLPYIVRKVASDLGLDGISTVRVFGHIYLPDVYRDVPTNHDIAECNAMAALREIDYYMNLERNGDRFSVLYPGINGGRINSNKRIFDRCTLIGGDRHIEIITGNPKEEAINVCVENLTNQCCDVVGRVNPTAVSAVDGGITDWFASSSFITNEETQIQQILNDENNHARYPTYGNYNYDIVGSSRVLFPTKTVINQFMGLIAAKANELLRTNRDALTEVDIDSFEAAVGINPIKIVDTEVEKVRRDIQNKLDSHPDRSWTVDDVESYMASELATIIDSAVSNFDSGSTLVNSIQGRINLEAKNIFTAADKGPYYLERLVNSYTDANGVHRGLYQRVSEYVVAIDNMIAASKCKEFEEARRSAKNDAIVVHRFRNNTVNHNKIANLKNALTNLYLEIFKEKLCEKLKATYYSSIDNRSIVSTVKRTLDAFIERVDILESVSSILTINGNKASSELEHLHNDPSSIFSVNEPDIRELCDSIKETAFREYTKIEADGGVARFATAFSQALVPGENSRYNWEFAAVGHYRFGTSNPAAAFRTFIKDYEPFSRMINLTMVDFFDDAFSAKTRQQKLSIVTRILQNISNGASPRFKAWNKPYFDFSNVATLKYAFMVLPKKFKSTAVTVDPESWEAIFNEAFNSVANVTANIGKNTYWSPDNDAIYGFTMYTKIPFFVHHKVGEYEKKYWANRYEGLHFNENPSKKPSFYDYPSLLPVSQYFRTEGNDMELYSCPQEVCFIERLNKLIAKGKNYGILVKDAQGMYYAKVIDTAKRLSDSSIENHVSNYVANNVNTSNIKVEEFDVLRSKLCDSIRAICGDAMEDIAIREIGISPTNDENLGIILRNQMSVYQKLKDEVEYFDDHVGKYIDEIIEKITYDKRCLLFCKMFAHGDIVPTENKNAWVYYCGSERNIILKMSEYPPIDNKPDPRLEYIEMEICSRLAADIVFNIGNSSKIESHLTQIMNNIIEGDATQRTIVEKEKFKEGCKNASARFRGVRDAIVGITGLDNKAKDFYDKMITYLDFIIQSLGIAD